VNAVPAAGPVPFVPAMAGRDLERAPRELPRDLPGDPSLVVMGFRMEHQRDIDAWAAAVPGVPFVEAVVMPYRYERRRRWVEGGMTANIEDPAVRARTWCLYTDVAAALAALDVRGIERVIAAVVGRDGRVTALARGAPDPGTAARFAAALRR